MEKLGTYSMYVIVLYCEGKAEGEMCSYTLPAIILLTLSVCVLS